MNWEDNWEEKEGLVVRELGRRIAPEEWLMGKEGEVKERMVNGRESTNFAWVLKIAFLQGLFKCNPFPSTLTGPSAT